MPWTLKSDKTGREYDFEDGVTPQEALKHMDTVLERDLEWKQVPGAIAAASGGQFARIGAGLMEAGAAVSGLVGDNPVQQALRDQAARAR